MEAKTKKTLIIWGVIILVILNVSSLATIWLHRYQYSNNRMYSKYGGKNMQQRQPRMAQHGPRSNSYFTRDLNLTSTQQTQFDSIWNKYSSLRREIEQEMAENRQLMSKMMGELNVDTAKIYNLSATQGELMQELDLSMIKMNLALRTVLEEEQLKPFLKRIESLSKKRGMKRQGSKRIREK